MVRSRYEQLVRQAEDERLSKALASGQREALACGADDLARWIRLEQLGYAAGNPAMTNEVVVPEYRTVTGAWLDAYGRVLAIDQPSLGFINETRIRSPRGRRLDDQANPGSPLSTRRPNRRPHRR